MRLNLVSGSKNIIAALALLLSLLPVALSQSTPATGALTGLVTDPRGAPAVGENVLVANTSNGQTLTFTTSARGIYSSGPLIPGDYTLALDVKGFAPVQLPVTINVGTTTSANIRLQLNGSDKKTYEAVKFHAAEATVQGVVTSPQLEGLPVNGRNFFDLAQLEPGIQIRDGARLDPSKSGYFAVSIEGNSGRSTRTLLDGIDITDERVGSPIQNISLSAIQEFQVAQSTPNISSPMTASGIINAVTRSGSNSYHGGGFYGFRDHSIGFAAFPGGKKPYFQRNQFGGNFGGALIADKLFFFVNAERTEQDFRGAPALNYPFNNLAANYSSPFRDNFLSGRLDWVGQNVRAFYRGSYDEDSAIAANDYSPFRIHDNSPSHVLGADFYRGNLTHSFRAGYSRYANHFSSPNQTVLFNVSPSITIQNSSIYAGPSAYLGQSNTQSSMQFRYDGSKVSNNHIFRFGASYNRIMTGGYVAAGLSAPIVTGSATFANEQAILGNPGAYAPALVSGDSAGALDNPLNYPVGSITISNGQRFFSEKSAFGLSHGGLTDNRIELYGGDSWKIKKNLTVNYGLHYLRDGGLTNSDLPAIPALNGFGPTLGGAVHQPNLNFSPQLGLAWAPRNWERTIFRAGIGLYYDSNLTGNIQADRALRLQQGQYFAQQSLCGPGEYAAYVPNGAAIASSDGLNIASQICGHALSSVVNGVSVAQAITDLQTAVQNASAAAGPNGFYAGTTGSTLGSMISPNYVSPRSLEMNFGLQHQFGRSTVLSIDYVRNSGTHYLMGVDRNHVGDAGNFNLNNALAAINRTLAAHAPTCGQVNASTSIAGINCYLRQVHNATISDFAVQGLDSSGNFANANAAYPGDNTSLGRGIFYEPIGNSRFRAIDVSVRSAVERPVRGVETMNLQVAYSWSKFQSNFATGNGNPGQGALSNAVDWDRPNAYFGPSGLDRRHQFTFGPILGLRRGFNLSILAHLDSPLPLTVFVPQLNGGGSPGEIFRSDITGDGTVGDLVSGSSIGSLKSGGSVSALNTLINSYNVNISGRLTPAGGALTNSGLFTQSQLLQLGAVTPALADVPTSSQSGWLKTVDLRLSWPYRFKERFVVEPSVSAFNVFNFANFDSSVNPSSGVLQPASTFSSNGSLGLGCGTASTCQISNRVGQGSGVYSQGSPRQFEFGLRFTF